MFLEPAPTRYDLYFVLFGFPVRVHPLFWLVALLLGLNAPDLPSLLVFMAAVFLAVLVHELGHALAIRAYGLAPSIILYGLGGLTTWSPRFVSRLQPDTWGHVLISIAGPGAGFLLAGLIAGALKLAGHAVVLVVGLPFGVLVGTPGPVGHPLMTEFINQLLFVTVAWGILNLLPVHPLDGGQIARHLFASWNPWDGSRQALVLSLVVALALVVVALAHFNIFMAILFGYLAMNSYAMLRGF